MNVKSQHRPSGEESDLSGLKILDDPALLGWGFVPGEEELVLRDGGFGLSHGRDTGGLDAVVISRSELGSPQR